MMEAVFSCGDSETGLGIRCPPASQGPIGDSVSIPHAMPRKHDQITEDDLVHALESVV
jgi:hypothetical protein